MAFGRQYGKPQVKSPFMSGNEYALTYGGQTSQPTVPASNSFVQQVGTMGAGTPIYGARINENPVDKQTQQIPGTYMGSSGLRYNDPMGPATAKPTVTAAGEPTTPILPATQTAKPRSYGMGVQASGGAMPSSPPPPTTKPGVGNLGGDVNVPEIGVHPWANNPGSGVDPNMGGNQPAPGGNNPLPPAGPPAAPPVGPPPGAPPAPNGQGLNNAFPNPGDREWFLQDQRQWWDGLSDEEKAELGYDTFEEYIDDVMQGLDEDFDPNRPPPGPRDPAPNPNNDPNAPVNPQPGDEAPPDLRFPDLPGGPDPSRPADPTIPWPGGTPPTTGGGGDGTANTGGNGGFPPGFNPDPLQGTPTGGGTIPTTGSPPGGNQLIQALFDEYQRAHNEGKKANEDRYKQLIDMLTGRYDRGLTNLEGAGEQGMADIDRDYERMGASLDQDLISRGLRNSTVRASVQRGAQDDRQANKRRLQEDIRKERLQTDAVLSGDIAGAVERRTDEYPSSQELLALALQLGNSGYYPTGGGGGGGGNTGPFITTPQGLVTNPNYRPPVPQLGQFSNPFGGNRWAPTGTRWAPT